MKKKLFKLIFPIMAVLTLSLLFGGCAALVSEDAARDAKVAEMAVPEAAYEEEIMAEMDMVAEETVSAGAADYTDTPKLDRMIIKSSYLEIEIGAGEFEDKLFSVSSLAERNGGFVSHSESYADPEGKISRGRITIRVPAERFDFILNEIKGLGTVMNLTVSGYDVTEEYVDLEARLRNLQAQEKVLLGLMEEAETVADSIEVQRELSIVQGDIEVLRGRLNYLDDRVSFSTIDVYLMEPQTIMEAPGWGFLDAIRRGARGAVRVFNGIITTLIVISPVLVLIAIILFIIWAIIRSRKRRRLKKKE